MTVTIVVNQGQEARLSVEGDWGNPNVQFSSSIYDLADGGAPGNLIGSFQISFVTDKEVLFRVPTNITMKMEGSYLFAVDACLDGVCAGTQGLLVIERTKQ